MGNKFHCSVLYKHRYTKARVTRVLTPHGSFTTPVFMPVGTRAGVNNMMPAELIEAGSQIILGGNTYHMLCAPGMEIIEKAGGMHRFMGWHGPMLTDSGGFQVFSLSKNKKICTIDEIGAHFKLPQSDSVIHMTPEVSLEAQKIIGADIIMAFDQCTPDDCSEAEVQMIMKRTHRWLEQSLNFHQRYPASKYGLSQALFGIIQGGIYKELRQQSAEFVTSLGLDGVAIGGETIGFDMSKTIDLIEWVLPYLPENKPRYSMGVGMYVQDLFDVVASGIDMFDCVAPTRNARHGALYCGEIMHDGHWFKFVSNYSNGRIQIKKACYADDNKPVMENCHCYTCQHYSRGALHHLAKQRTNIFTTLACIHNTHVMHDACTQMRNKIIEQNIC